MINSGIYKIISPSEKVYIGKSKNIKRRFSTYKKDVENVKSQTRLYNSFLKYGTENHIFEVIEYCEIIDLYCRERFWQDFYNAIGDKGLNCMLTACEEHPAQISEETRRKKSEATKGKKNPMYGVDRPPEWREFMSNLMREKFKDKENHPNYGNIYSKERLEKMRLMNVGKKASEETKNKMSLSHKNKIIDERGRRNMSESKLGEKNPMFSQFGIDNVNSKIIIDTSNGDIIYGVAELSRKTSISRSILKDQLNGYCINKTPFLFLDVVENFEEYFANKQIEMINKFTEEELNILRNNETSFLTKNYPKLYDKYKKYNPDNKLFPRAKWTEESVIAEMSKYSSIRELRRENEPLKQVIYKRFNYLKFFYAKKE